MRTKHWQPVSIQLKTNTDTFLWHSGIVSLVASTNLHRTLLVLGWVTIFGGYTILVCNRPTRYTQTCIPLGLLTSVPALTGWGKGENITSAGWQVTLCDPIWHMSSCSNEAYLQTAIFHFLYFQFTLHTDAPTYAVLRLYSELRLYVCSTRHKICREAILETFLPAT